MVTVRYLISPGNMRGTNAHLRLREALGCIFTLANPYKQIMQTIRFTVEERTIVTGVPDSQGLHTCLTACQSSTSAVNDNDAHFRKTKIHTYNATKYVRVLKNLWFEQIYAATCKCTSYHTCLLSLTCETTLRMSIWLRTTTTASCGWH